MSSGDGKAWYYAGISGLVLVVALNTVTTLRQAPWEDEVFAVSTSWSMSRSQAPILSVLAQYPNTISPIRFYGPVSFEVESFLIRAFGLSPIAWRLACSLGILLTLVVSIQLIKAAGGDRWSCLLGALLIALSSSVSSPFPGRWDAVTVGLFLGGLLSFVSAWNGSLKSALIRLTLSGFLFGISIASTPRSLTLTLAFAAAAFLTGALFTRLRKSLILGTLYSLAIAMTTHTLLVLPWGQNSVSWYAEVRRVTRADYINATPIAGRGLWTLDLQHHRALATLLLLFVSAAALSTVGRRSHLDPERLPLKVFLTAFGGINLILMLILLANALGQISFCVPSIAVAGSCWVSRDYLRQDLKSVIIALLTLCLLVMGLEEVEQAGSVILTWSQRNTGALTAFVHRNVPAGSVVYGPIGDYFFAVELAGDQYLYTFERTTPGLYSRPLASIPDVGERLDQMICSRPTYVIWPKPDPMQQPLEQLMPEPVRDRLQGPIAEFDQPALPGWKRWILTRLGDIGGKNGFPSVLIYATKSASCPQR